MHIHKCYLAEDNKGKQGSVFACVMVDTVEEFGMRVSLKPELAEQA